MKRKKGFTTLEWIIALIISSIVLILVLASFFGPKIGLFNYFSNFVDTVKKYLPGKEEIDVPEIKESEKFNDFFDKFTEKLETAVGDKEECLIEYKKFDDFDGFKVEMMNVGDNLILRKKNELDQAIEQKEIEELNFCLIEPNAFYDNHLDKEKSPCTKSERQCEKDFIDKDVLVFTASDIEGLGFQDGGLIYKPRNDRVCFIPTHKVFGTWKFLGCDVGSNTIDNNCIKKIKQNINLC